MNSELISIVVPIYKVEQYLARCIESLINQSYKNLEIILVDDGSPDGCGAICEKYKEKDSRIRVLHKENGGLSDARNAGLEIAKGRRIAFIDSDDFIHPEMIEILYDEMSKNNAGISLCQFQMGPDVSTVEWDEKADESIVITDDSQRLQYFLGESTMPTFTVAWNKLYDISLFESIRYPKGKIHEDEFTTYKLFELTDRVVYVRRKLYYYVQREGSIMSNGFNPKSLHRLDAYAERLRYYREANKYDWFEKVLLLYKIFLEKIFAGDSIENMDAYYGKYKKEYNQFVVNSLLKLPISLKKKLGYIVSVFRIKF